MRNDVVHSANLYKDEFYNYQKFLISILAIITTSMSIVIVVSSEMDVLLYFSMLGILNVLITSLYILNVEITIGYPSLHHKDNVEELDKINISNMENLYDGILKLDSIIKRAIIFMIALIIILLIYMLHS